jgi:membrane-bound lytic murein transglycosylase MltF
MYVRTDSSYADSIATLNQTLTKGGARPVKIIPADGALEDEDIMEMVQSGLLPYAVVDAYKADVWAKILPKLTVRRDLALRTDGSIAWAFRKDSSQLAAKLNAFISQNKIGTTFGNIIKRRYYADDKLLRNAMAKPDRERFAQLADSFKANGTTNRFDWLMLAAQGYQESQLDQSRRSQKGAVGIMQLLPSTAKEVGVTGIEADAGKNITAGALYLRMLIDKYVNDLDLDEKDRVLFAFAAYNAGPGNLRKFRKIAETTGLDPKLWFNNVEQGAAKTVGRETVQYIGNIYRYYIAYKLTSELASTPVPKQ